MTDSVGPRLGRRCARLVWAVGMVLFGTSCERPAEVAVPIHQALISPDPGALFDFAAMVGPTGLTEAVDEWVGTPWRIDLGQEVRSGLLAPPGSVIERSVVTGEGSRLRFAYGALPGLERAVTFRISAETGVEGETELFSDRLGAGDDRGWITGDVPLPPGTPVVLRFRTETDGEPLTSSSLLAWGSLEVVTSPTGERPPNVIVVSADTLRADHMSLYGYPRPTTPNIDAWARDHAVVFERVVASSPWTLPSHASIFTGLGPLRHDVNYEEALPGTAWTFPEHLKSAGYATYAVTGGGYLAPQYGFSQGFDSYRYWARADGEIEASTDLVLEMIEDLPEPFLLFLHSYEVHSPYRARSPYFEEFSDRGATGPLSRASIVEHSYIMDVESDFKALKWFRWADEAEQPTDRFVSEAELPELVARYDSSVAHFDHHLGKILRRIQSSPRLGDRTTVILTSDHGEALGEKGLGSHSSLYDFNLRVPLAISAPRGRAGQRIDSQVRLIDIAPTVVELAGLPVMEGGEGESLLGLVAGTRSTFPREAWSLAASSNYGVSLSIAGRLKYVFTDTIWADGEDRAELYSLVEDPAEVSDFAREYPGVGALREKVVERLDTLGKGLMITLTNPGPGILEGAVSGKAFRINRFKTWRGSNEGLSWNRRVLSFRIEAGREVEILVTDVPVRDPIRVRLDHRDGTEIGSREAEVIPDAIDVAWSLEVDGPWTELHGSPSIRIVDRLGGDSETEEELQMTDELEEQLRALGYLD